MIWLIALPVLVLAAWAGTVVRRMRRLPGIIRGISAMDPDPDMTELLALRDRGGIDEETFQRMRDRFEARRQAEGPPGQAARLQSARAAPERGPDGP